MSSHRRGFYDDYDRNRHSSSSRNYHHKSSREDELREEMAIADQYVELVMGRDNSGIESIRSRTGCEIRLRHQIKITGYRTLQLKGTKESIESAKKHIITMVRTAENEKYLASTPQPTPHITIDIPIPPDRCGMVIGKGGEMRKKLQSISNCQIYLVQENKSADSVKPLRITGTPESVKIAQNLVNGLLQNKEYIPGPKMIASGPQTQTTVIVQVPRNTVGAIMGLQGSTIRKISDGTGTKIQFLPDDDPTMLERKMAIMGMRVRIELAIRSIKQIVDSVVDKNSSKAIYTIDIPAQKVGLVIGRGGEIIKQINAETGAHCELGRLANSSSTERQIVIHAPTERQVDHAKHLIRQRVGDIPPMTPFIWNKQEAFGDAPRQAPPQLQYPPYYYLQPPLQHPGQLQYPHPAPPPPEFPPPPPLPQLQYPRPAPPPPEFPPPPPPPQLQYPQYHEQPSAYAQQFFQAPPHELQYPGQLQYPQYAQLTPNFVYHPPEGSSSQLSSLTPESQFNGVKTHGIMDQPPPEVKMEQKVEMEEEKEEKKREEPVLIDLTVETNEPVDYTRHWMNYYKKIGDKEGIARVKERMESMKK